MGDSGLIAQNFPFYFIREFFTSLNLVVPILSAFFPGQRKSVFIYNYICNPGFPFTGKTREENKSVRRQKCLKE